ncbi:MAG TPA: hypothetical protein VHD87_15745, partial [Acidimicrobiales bacterium]|nr:hypothetical protein [Acidimicrobiales bacterium]
EVRSAAVQRMGQRVARATDVITRRQPQLKRFLVDGFARVNRRGERQADLDDATRARLADLFAPANAALAAALRAAGYERLPDWVRGATA